METYELLDYFTPPEEGDMAICDLCTKNGKSYRIPASWLEQMAKHLEKVHNIKVEVSS